MGVCERQYETLLCGGLQEHGLRDSGAVRVADSGTHGGLHGFRFFANQDPQELSGVFQAGIGAEPRVENSWSPGHGLLSDHDRAESRVGFLQAGEAQYHCQVVGDRDSRRRFLCSEGHERDWWPQ